MVEHLDTTTISRLRRRAANDQHAAACADYLTSTDAARRRRVLTLLLGHVPTASEWTRHETWRAAAQDATDTDLTKEEIGGMAGLPPAEIRRMATQGEMPAPRWWNCERWKRDEITAWLAQRQLG